ncbi:MAG: SDR family NAD(P)-dependent oxidoreductase [Acidobacteria bacterium]|nr:SDR family NAD(P)-dependent oxidoreductase [Acidobacteriota bacterium]
MSRIQGKWALITGASAGIGAACARRLAADGANLILTARRLERLETLHDELTTTASSTVLVFRLDVRERWEVAHLAEELAARSVEPDVLLNNAGLAAGLDKLHEGDLENWDRMLDTNVKGLLYMSRAFIPGMVERNSGHIVNIGSIAGYQAYPGGNVYNASKFAVRALTEAMSLDLLGTRVRVSSVNPGLVETEFSEVRFDGDTARARQVYQGYTPLRPQDIADAVSYIVNAPEHVNVRELMILPTAQRNAYCLHKEP